MPLLGLIEGLSNVIAGPSPLYKVDLDIPSPKPQHSPLICFSSDTWRLPYPPSSSGKSLHLSSPRPEFSIRRMSGELPRSRSHLMFRIDSVRAEGEESRDIASQKDQRHNAYAQVGLPPADTARGLFLHWEEAIADISAKGSLNGVSISQDKGFSL
ncbi:uncharacterized protein LOC143855555 isoform X2 [Tasmannia lanceolata]|uniref:uncharacterized protein LOC143855555 isoform X2 n=1 Tax=Tasmannia lanceolata TaxID=3420 RepID=UPI0040640B41